MIVPELLIKFELRVAKLAISCHCTEIDDDLTDLKQNGSHNWRHFQMFLFPPHPRNGTKKHGMHSKIRKPLSSDVKKLIKQMLKY
jgi:hypothetical protein